MNPKLITSAAGAEGFPDDAGREVAVVGRSNSGKSSAINRLVGGRLARVSKTPGRTQLINFFELGRGQRLVDLPGYGFAQVPDKVRRRWQALVDAYFASRRSLAGLVLTVDARRGPNEADQAMLAWAGELELPVMVLLTKADKLSRGAGSSLCLAVARNLPDGVTVTLFSAQDGTGAAAAKATLGAWLGLDFGG
jgi:GTP-binding protein